MLECVRVSLFKHSFCTELTICTLNREAPPESTWTGEAWALSSCENLAGCEPNALVPGSKLDTSKRSEQREILESIQK